MRRQGHIHVIFTIRLSLLCGLVDCVELDRKRYRSTQPSRGSNGDRVLDNAECDACGLRYHFPEAIFAVPLSVVYSSHFRQKISRQAGPVPLLHPVPIVFSPTTIHHRLSKNDLACRQSTYFPHQVLVKITKVNPARARQKASAGRSATWQEIGEQLETYVEKHGKIEIWLDWSNSNIGYKGVHAGLKSVCYDHLLPPQPSVEFRPLLWWRRTRKALQLDDLKLAQANLHRILYPEDMELALLAHRAGPDRALHGDTGTGF